MRGTLGGSRGASRVHYSQVQPGLRRGETQRVDRELDGPAHRTGAVTDVGLATHQDRPSAPAWRAAGPRHLAGVQRIHASVAVEDGEQRRRVADPLAHVVVRRVGVAASRTRSASSAVAVLVGPGRAEPELARSGPCRAAARRRRRRVQLGSLRQRRADEQSAVRAAGDRELLGRRPAVRDQLLGRGVEVVEDVLLVAEHPVAVPVLALLAAAAQVGDGVDAAGLDPGQDRRGVRRGQRDAEAAVAVQDGRTRPGRAASAGEMTNMRTSVPSFDGYVDLLGGDRRDVDRRRAARPRASSRRSRRRSGRSSAAWCGRCSRTRPRGRPRDVSPSPAIVPEPGSGHRRRSARRSPVVHRDLGRPRGGCARTSSTGRSSSSPSRIATSLEHRLGVLGDRGPPVLDDQAARVGHARAGRAARRGRCRRRAGRRGRTYSESARPRPPAR